MRQYISTQSIQCAPQHSDGLSPCSAPVLIHASGGGSSPAPVSGPSGIPLLSRSPSSPSPSLSPPFQPTPPQHLSSPGSSSSPLSPSPLPLVPPSHPASSTASSSLPPLPPSNTSPTRITMPSAGAAAVAAIHSPCAPDKVAAHAHPAAVPTTTARSPPPTSRRRQSIPGGLPAPSAAPSAPAAAATAAALSIAAGAAAAAACTTIPPRPTSTTAHRPAAATSLPSLARRSASLMLATGLPPVTYAHPLAPGGSPSRRRPATAYARPAAMTPHEALVPTAGMATQHITLPPLGHTDSAGAFEAPPSIPVELPSADGLLIVDTACMVTARDAFQSASRQPQTTHSAPPSRPASPPTTTGYLGGFGGFLSARGRTDSLSTTLPAPLPKTLANAMVPATKAAVDAYAVPRGFAGTSAGIPAETSPQHAGKASPAPTPQSAPVVVVGWRRQITRKRVFLCHAGLPPAELQVRGTVLARTAQSSEYSSHCPPSRARRARARGHSKA